MSLVPVVFISAKTNKHPRRLGSDEDRDTLEKYDGNIFDTYRFPGNLEKSKVSRVYGILEKYCGKIFDIEVSRVYGIF